MGCKGITVQAAHSHGLTSMDAKELLEAKMVERVLLPVVLLTRLSGGSATTQCTFLSDGEAKGKVREEEAELVRGASAKAMGGGIATAAVSGGGGGEGWGGGRPGSGAWGGSHLLPPGRAGVGLLLRKSEHGLRVAEVFPEGPAGVDGRIDVGDVLFAIDDTPTEGEEYRPIPQQTCVSPCHAPALPPPKFFSFACQCKKLGGPADTLRTLNCDEGKDLLDARGESNPKLSLLTPKS